VTPATRGTPRGALAALPCVAFQQQSLHPSSAETQP
jgi:hypothetical protein